MRKLRALLLRLGGLFTRRRRAAEFADELESNLQMQIEDNVRAGMSPEEARYAALRKFGNVMQVKEDAWNLWSFVWLEQLWQDVRFSVRMLAKNPGFTAVAVTTLALGIGANTAIFGLIDTLMLRLLPVRDPGQLVELLHRYPGEPRMNGFSQQSYEHFREHNRVFSGLIGFAPTRFSVRRTGAEPETVNGEYIVANYFPVLGIEPALGRFIDPEHDRPGSPGSAVAVLSWSYWKSRFNLDRAILGKEIIVGDVPVTVIGVAPPEFHGLAMWSKPDVWVPINPSSSYGHAGRSSNLPLNLVGRLMPGVSLKQAHAEMNVLFQFTIDEMTRNSKDPQWRQLKLEMVPAGAGLAFLRDHVSRPLFILMGLVGTLLLIACASIATLLLARGTAREHEMALRVALGAGRRRLMGQVLTESVRLAAMGSLPGILFAYYAARYLAHLVLSGRPIPGLPQGLRIEVYPDAHVLLFTVGAALLTGMLFGAIPALRAVATAPASLLQGSVRARQARSTRWLGGTLVAAQISLSVVLLSLAGVFTLNLSDLQSHLGFQRDHLLVVTLDPASSGFAGAQLSYLYRELLARLEALPGVRNASLGSPVPTSGAGAAGFIKVERFEERPQDRRSVAMSWVAPDYFETFRIPLLAGRGFSFGDSGGRRLVIINQALARYYFAGTNPLGRQLIIERDWKNIGAAENPYEIVGVVGDAKYDDAHGAPPRTLYLPALQASGVSSHQFILRTSVRAPAVSAEVERAIAEMLKGVKLVNVTTMDEQVNASLVPERLMAALSNAFSALGSLIAAIGLYGLLTYSAARRTREIGIRMALGATRREVTCMVLRDAMVMVAAGLAAGIPIAIWARTLAGSIIPGLPPNAFLPLAVGPVGIVALALLASYIPARRATKVDPMVALRYE